MAFYQAGRPEVATALWRDLVPWFGLDAPGHAHEVPHVPEVLEPVDRPDDRVDLAPRQGFDVPKGVRHRTRAPERAVILMVERADIVPTGD